MNYSLRVLVDRRQRQRQRESYIVTTSVRGLKAR